MQEIYELNIMREIVEKIHARDQKKNEKQIFHTKLKQKKKRRKILKEREREKSYYFYSRNVFRSFCKRKNKIRRRRSLRPDLIYTPQ